MKTYPPLLQQVLDETAVERQRITEEVKNKYQNAELKELTNELLEALEVCAHVIGHNSCTDGRTPNGFAVALDKARAAIAKATNYQK